MNMDYEHYMRKALDLAREALSAGEFPVGCVLVYQDRILATGSRTGSSGDFPNEIDHAEIVALRCLAGIGEKIDHKKITLFSTMEPCLMCLGAVVLSGIGEIVYAYEDVMGGCMRCDLQALSPLYRNHKISIVANVLRGESLELFKAFFKNPENSYWRESLLARYTLDQ
jgi:tRNA(adenine34) deaminase